MTAAELPRLSLATLGSRAGAWTPPAVDPRTLRTGIVHLGIGAFHRVHQAVVTEGAAAATGSTRWGIAGVTQRSAAVRDQLAPQDGLYCVREQGPGAAPLHVVGSVREVLDGAGDPAAVVARIGDPDVQVVTLTVTEKGYRRAGDGTLDHADPLVAADLAGAHPRSAVGRVVRGLQQRCTSSGAPVTVLSCDNLVGNGQVLRSLVEDFVDRLPPADAEPLRSWMSTSVRFPSCMVDRIVPATTGADRAAAADLLGLRDEALVVTEPFLQWVVEDDFAADRPAWELAGAVLTRDVAPYEAVKLRMLNATHSMLAYLGALRGYPTISEALRDPELAGWAEALLVEDVEVTLSPPLGLDLQRYRASVLERFANPGLRHTTRQVAMDGSQKLPVRLLGTVRDRLAAGQVPRWAALAVAGWMVYVGVREDAYGAPLVVDDPLADRLAAAARGRGDDPARLVAGMLDVTEVFGPDLRDHQGLRAALVEAVGMLRAPLPGA